MDNRTYLVIGATGKAGRETVKSLQDRGKKVRTAVRNMEKAKSMNWKDVEIVFFDYAKPESFKPAFEGIERMFMVPPPMTRNTDEIAIPMINVAEECGINHIVYTSGMAAELVIEPTHAMLKIERYLEKSSIDCTFLDLTWFMQNCNDWLLTDITEKNGIFAPTDDAKINFVDARDIGEVAAIALITDEHKNQRYEITGGEAIDHYEVARLLTKYSGRKISYYPISETETRKVSRADKWGEETFDIVMTTFKRSREGVYEKISPSVEQIIGRAPITFEKYAQDYADCFK